MVLKVICLGHFRDLLCFPKYLPCSRAERLGLSWATLNGRGGRHGSWQVWGRVGNSGGTCSGRGVGAGRRATGFRSVKASGEPPRKDF